MIETQTQSLSRLNSRNPAFSCYLLVEVEHIANQYKFSTQRRSRRRADGVTQLVVVIIYRISTSVNLSMI